MIKGGFFLMAFIVCGGLLSGQSGEIVGVRNDGSTFNALNLLTKADTVLGNAGGAIVWQGNSTYDTQGNRYFGKNGAYLYEIDGQTGALIYSLLGLNAFSGIEYDEGCDCLKGIYIDFNDYSCYFASFDLQNKSLSNINQIPLHPIHFGESTFDHVNGRYFRKDQNSVEVIDNLGVIIDVLPDPRGLNSIEYDPNGDKIMGYFLNDPYLVLSSIDVKSHQFDFIDSISVSVAVLPGESTFDAVNQRYFFKTMDGLFSYDLQNQIFESFPNALSESTGIEYKVAAKPIVTTALKEAERHADVVVYPNPGDREFYFTGIKAGSRLKIVNSLGQLVLEELLEENEVHVILSKANQGIYFYEISYNTLREVRGKLVLR